MAHEYEEPAGADLMMIDDGCCAELTETNGQDIIQLTGSTGRQIAIPAEDAPHMAAMLLTLWQENSCTCEACGCDDDDDDCGDDE